MASCMWSGDALVSTTQSIETTKSALDKGKAAEELGMRFVVWQEDFGPYFSFRENEKLASSRDELESEVSRGIRIGFLSSLLCPP